MQVREHHRRDEIVLVVLSGGLVEPTRHILLVLVRLQLLLMELDSQVLHVRLLWYSFSACTLSNIGFFTTKDVTASDGTRDSRLGLFWICELLVSSGLTVHRRSCAISATKQSIL